MAGPYGYQGGGGGGLVAGTSSGDPDLDRVMQLLSTLEMSPSPQAPVPPKPINRGWQILGAIGDALMAAGAVRAHQNPPSSGAFSQFMRERQHGQERAQSDYQRRLVENESANRTLRNQVRMTTLRREPRAVHIDPFVMDVGGVPHNMRRVVDPETGRAIGEPEDLGPVGYAQKAEPRTSLTPGEANTEKDRAARARETAISKVNKLRTESIDLNARMAALRNHIGQGREPGVASKIPFMAGTPGKPGTQWTDVIPAADEAGAKVPKALEPFVGMTYRQAHDAMKSKNDATVKEINRLWGVANPGGGPAPMVRVPRQKPSEKAATVQGYATSEINALRDAMNEDERDEFDGYSPEDKKRVLDSAYGRGQ